MSFHWSWFIVLGAWRDICSLSYQFVSSFVLFNLCAKIYMCVCVCARVYIRYQYQYQYSLSMYMDL